MVTGEEVGSSEGFLWCENNMRECDGNNIVEAINH